MTAKEIEKLAETQWEGCHHCDDNDKYFWISGFVHGYLNARVDNLEKQIGESRNKIADILINNVNPKCKYCGGEDKGQ
jgi:hypothetical protein